MVAKKGVTGLEEWVLDGLVEIGEPDSEEVVQV